MTVYVVPFVHSGEEIFYDPHAHGDERIKPFIAMREAIEDAGYNFRVTRTCENLQDSWRSRPTRQGPTAWQ